MMRNMILALMLLVLGFAIAPLSTLSWRQIMDSDEFDNFTIGQIALFGALTGCGVVLVLQGLIMALSGI
jgi:hypothetical protein